jgi:hypothetical protein
MVTVDAIDKFENPTYMQKWKEEVSTGSYRSYAMARRQNGKNAYFLYYSRVYVKLQKIITHDQIELKCWQKYQNVRNFMLHEVPG